MPSLTGISFCSISDMCPYGVPFCWCSGASPILRDDEAKTVSNIDSHDLYASYCSPPFPVVVAPSPTSGEQLLDLSFRGAGHPDCIQQPPNYVIDYWSHRLGLSVQTTSAENLSNSATLPPPLPVFDKTSSHVSPRFIISYRMCSFFQMYLYFEDGPLTGFH